MYFECNNLTIFLVVKNFFDSKEIFFDDATSLWKSSKSTTLENKMPHLPFIEYVSFSFFVFGSTPREKSQLMASILQSLFK